MSFNSYIQGEFYSNLLKIVIQLDLISVIGTEKLSISELQNKLESKAQSIKALIDLLVEMEILQCKDSLYFCSDIALKFLHPKSDHYYGEYIIHQSTYFIPKLNKHITQIFEEGEYPKTYNHFTSFPKENMFYQNDIELTEFNKFSAATAKSFGTRLAKSYNFSNINSIVDIGGNDGSLVIELLKEYPHLQAAIYDLESMRNTFQRNLEKNNLVDQVQFISGNIFVDDYPESDCYLCRNLLHDFDDEAARHILKNIQKALRPNGELILIENILDHPSPQARLVNHKENFYLSVIGDAKAHFSRERKLTTFKEWFKEFGLDYAEISRPLDTNYVIIGLKADSSKNKSAPTALKLVESGGFTDEVIETKLADVQFDDSKAQIVLKHMKQNTRQMVELGFRLNGLYQSIKFNGPHRSTNLMKIYQRIQLLTVYNHNFDQDYGGQIEFDFLDKLGLNFKYKKLILKIVYKNGFWKIQNKKGEGVTELKFQLKKKLFFTQGLELLTE